MHLSTKGTGMDIHTYLDEWQTIEPNRCSFVAEDRWRFHFESLLEPPDTYPLQLECDVITVHGVGVIEDLIKGCIEERSGWDYQLNFDRSEELFIGAITDNRGDKYIGLESLNPGIALLTAYINTLKNQGGT